MNIVFQMALGGGIFAILAFVHFFVDWIFQSHSEAMVKHNNPKIRAKHCAIYTLGFLPLFYLFGFSWWEWLVGINILFWSHFGEDTYLLVYLWAKYIRRPPQMIEPNDPKIGFVQFVETPLGKILMITVDQLVHLAFLFPVVWLVMRHLIVSCK
jgi:hypothetical protein